MYRKVVVVNMELFIVVLLIIVFLKKHAVPSDSCFLVVDPSSNHCFVKTFVKSYVVTFFTVVCWWQPQFIWIKSYVSKHKPCFIVKWRKDKLLKKDYLVARLPLLQGQGKD